jgi:hypothetical protein
MPKKPFLSDYEHDIFVTYGHEKTSNKWVLKLQVDLSDALDEILQSKIKRRFIDVYIDEKLRKNLRLRNQLQKHAEESAFLLVVMSPFYLDSDWCRNELAWFAAAASLRAMPDRRIFIVHQYPTERASWPHELTDLTPYLFFARYGEIDLPVGRFGDEDERVYLEAVYSLAGQIKLQIDELQAEAKKFRPSSAPPAPPLPQPASTSLPTLWVCLEIAGASPEAKEMKSRVQSVLKAKNVNFFSADDDGPAPRDPSSAEKFRQRVLKAKAVSDGLILLRLHGDAPIKDWQLEYVGEVGLLLARERADRRLPPVLLIEAPLLNPDPSAAGLDTLYYDTPDFAQRLTDWIDRLPPKQMGA